ncbi:TldD/PmbA family protein [Metallumcola ferriviriculae]|uniref:TldD/PmbA family protein n=1 Tax=Metallumcola ferriviriculae TaxID=3039180 RepID=A0AAU0UPT7_9FIRM|nr:TldD/PmbA family protein [Desulfitibacteraceae bacterium MK1]
MVSREDANRILKIALQNGGNFADIFVERKRNVSISLEAGKIERVNSGLDVGAGIRVISGDSTSFAHTNDVTLKGLEALADIVSKAAKGHNGQKDIPVIDRPANWRPDFKKKPGSVPTEAKVALVEKMDKAARSADPRIKQVAVGYGDVEQDVLIANSDGVYVEDQRVRTRMVINAVAQEGDAIQTGFDSLGGLQGFEIFDTANVEETARNAAKRAVALLSAKPAPAGRMPVVMAGEAGGTMVHEACGHGLEADLVQKKLSVYGGKVGEKVASELITVIDDATIPGKYGSLAYDDEGTPGEKSVLIEKGVLKSYMYDKLTAIKEKRESNGNGRRQSYQDRPIPRMTNTYIASGESDPEEIIRDTKSGLLVKKMGGGQVNTTNGDFVFDVAEGYLIEDGQVGALVRGATLTGNGPKVLQIVDRVGNDLGFAIGTCGKDGQGAPVSDAQPTIRIPEMVVGGILDED